LGDLVGFVAADKFLLSEEDARIVLRIRVLVRIVKERLVNLRTFNLWMSLGREVIIEIALFGGRWLIF
jgi:hypothetical protein